MTGLNLVFGGTPDFAVPALAALLESGHRIAAVYTQPDRPAGRGQKVQMSAVKEAALRHGLHVEQPRTLRDPAAVAHLASFKPNAMIVVAYGLILPQNVLDIPPLGCINIHGSLLPRWRGAAPIQRALLAGDTETGITIMKMDAGLDTGAMLSVHPIDIGPHENAGDLHDRLADVGAQAVCATLAKYAAGEIVPRPQPENGVPYAHKIRKEEALIDWSQPARTLDRLIRAFNPWPIAETRWRGQQLRVWEATYSAEGNSAVVGKVIAANDDGICVATGEGTVLIKRLQLPGRKALPAAEFLRSQSIAGDVLGLS
jgi:methionyl-tRNA formyltransferase